MVDLLAPVTHILPSATIRRERFLPIPGKVVVRKGQKVGATDTVAETKLAPEHLFLDLPRGLGLPASEIGKHVQVKTGEQVAEGDILAGPVGFTRRVVRAPRSGRVVAAEAGQLLIEVDSQPFELKAGMPGTVIDIVAGYGVILEVTGALIQGVWGNGKLDSGLLQVIAKSADHIITNDQLDESMRGAVLLGGYCGQKEVLKTAADLPLRGLILSSLNPDLIPVAQALAVPVLVLEGFGMRPMSAAVFKLLSTSERRDVALNAEGWDPFAGTRPEIVIALPAFGQPALARDATEFSAGQQVRLFSPVAVTQTGTLVRLRGVTVLPNGIRTQAAEIRMDDGESLVVPLANLEVVE